MTSSSCRVLRATAPQPGAIAVLQLIGEVEPVLEALTGIGDWPPGRARLVRFDDLDEGIAVRLADDLAQLMPHGGPRVVQRMFEWLAHEGVATDVDAAEPEEMYPEAQDRYEALALAATARAASPLAIDLLLDQPRRWRLVETLTDEDRARSQRLDRLIQPPVVALAGPANVGKSTLSNTLLGRCMSIAAEGPGTTRDYTAGRIELAGLVVDWHDTPGLREATDAIESKAVELARRLLQRADFLIAMTDAEHDWPVLPRTADLRVAGKRDVVRRDDADLSVSATIGTAIPEFVTAVRDRLVPPADLEHPGPWLFDSRLTRPG
ncbi:MAG: GTPase [Planctomycetota bacterium]|jgi:tRNA U34 5-carboxymethylaminomethyl modifying GTPase MnmE/TrmE